MPVHFKQYLFRLNEFYGLENGGETVRSADVHVYFKQKKRIQQHRRLTIHRQFLTLCIDLRKEEEILRKEMNRTTRYQINKGGRDELSIQCISKPSISEIKEFERFFNLFAKQKGIAACKTKRLMGLRNDNMLVISNAYHKDGRKLASHAYITIKKCAIMLYSCSGRFVNSDIPSLNISRANRYLHWHNILYFKKLEYNTYDFFGLSIDPHNKDQQNINAFKKGFGGEEVIEFQSIIPQNIKGLAAIIILRFLWRKHMEVIRNGELPVSNYLAKVQTYTMNEFSR